MERILVIDDDNGILDSVSKILKYSGYEVEVAHDGEEGVRLFSIAHSFDCVVTDRDIVKCCVWNSLGGDPNFLYSIHETDTANDLW